MSTEKKKPRWTTAKKAAAKRTKAAKGSGSPDAAPPGKKPRWVDGAPARPASMDNGRRRGSDGSVGASRPPRTSRASTERPSFERERTSFDKDRTASQSWGRDRPRRDRPDGGGAKSDRQPVGERRSPEKRADRGRPARDRSDGGQAPRDGFAGERRERPDRAMRRHGDGPHHETRPIRAERARAHRIPGQPSAAQPPAPGPEESGVGFGDLGLPAAIVAALSARGIRTPFPIQEATIPDALAGRDLLGRGRTGSGKTLAFGLPTLTRLSSGQTKPNRPRALVLVPTRELALQVADALEPISRALGVRQKVVAGGMPYPPQLTALDRGLHLVIATPGRLQDLIERGAAILDDVEIVVLDEADHMADLGFLPEVTEIMDLVPAGGQRLLFSATLDGGIDELARNYLLDPVTHSTDDATAAVTTMAHRILLIEPSMKKTLTARISGRPGKTLVFVRTQLGADRVARQLRESGILAGPLHGGLNQSVRNKVLDAFKDGRLDVLVATDVAARGIHVDDIDLVVQVDPPADHKTYVHRSGRTARAGSAGAVVTLALPHQRKAMEKIIDEVALTIAPERIDAAGAAAEGAEPTGAAVPEAVWQSIVAPRPQQRRGTGPRRPRPDGATHRPRTPRERPR